MQQIVEFMAGEGSGILDAAINLIGVIVLAIAGKLATTKTHQAVSESRAGAVYKALLVGARATYTSIYDKVKEAAKDGVITTKEREVLHEKAWQEALKVADGPTKDALQDLAESEFEMLLNRAINQLKAEGQAAKAPA